MQRKEKPRYSMRSNITYMLRLAWKHQKRVIFMLLLTVFVNIGLNLTELFVSPSILQRVEQSAPMGELLTVIGVFTVLLMVLKALQEFCMSDANQIGQIYVRTRIILAINHKSFTTSYPNTCDPKAKKCLAEANRATGGNSEATEHVWQTLTDLLTAVVGFVLYLLLLQNLSQVLVLVVIGTSIAGFFASRWADNWSFRHRKQVQEFYAKANYLKYRSESTELAKDIRIFGL